MTAKIETTRIAKNTIALYIRMGLTMLVSLYTSRVLLQVLGVDDFGIYNLVAGIVVLFSFLNTAMNTATLRFLNFALGKGRSTQAARYFSMSISVYILVIVITVILAETLGLWLLNHQLNIPIKRLTASNIVFQFAIANTVIGILQVPYNAVIIAYERMSFFAWVSIIKVVLLLLVVFIVPWSPGDKLVFYAFLSTMVNLFMQIIYVFYCRKAFPGVARYRPFWDAKIFKELCSFSGWSLLGGLANIGNNQGLNMILNIFGGVALNAATGLAHQVGAAIYQFVANFQTAYNPQIIKLYSAGNQNAFITLVFQASKISYYMMLLFTLPVAINIDFILKLWLDNIPPYTADFIIWTLVYSMIDSIGGPLWLSVQATGKIRNYQLIVSVFILSNIPIAILLMYMGFSPVWTFVLKAFINAITTIWRIFYLKHKVNLPSWLFIREICGRAIIVTLVASLLPVMFAILIDNTIFRFFITSFTALIGVVIVSFFLGFKTEERNAIVSFLQMRFKQLSFLNHLIRN